MVLNLIQTIQERVNKPLKTGLKNGVRTERIEKLEKELREKSLEALKRDKGEKALQIIEFHEKYLKVRNV